MQFFIRKFYLLVIALVVCQCKNEGDNDASVVDTSSHLSATSVGQKDDIDAPADADGEMQDVIGEYVKGYDNKVVFDSTYVSNDDTVQVHFKYYCVFDSAVNVPENYVSIYGLKKFTTHNFEFTLEVRNGNKVVIDTVFKKSQFNSYLDEPLRTYGVLLYPEVKVKDAVLNIDYSVSIPLTDIGVGIGMEITSKGKVDTKKI